MECSICNRSQSWLICIGIDNVCNKCIEKNTIFKEIRFSDERRLKSALKKRVIRNFQELCSISDRDFEDILLTDPNIGIFRPNKIGKMKEASP